MLLFHSRVGVYTCTCLTFLLEFVSMVLRAPSIVLSVVWR